MSDNEPDKQSPTVLEGQEAFASRALAMVSQAESEVVLMSQNLEGLTYGTEAFAEAVGNFILQHSHTRVRVLISDTKQAVGQSMRLIELGRKLTTFMEFRALSDERRQLIREEYLVTDGRILLYREDPTDLESRYYATAPHVARLKIKDFDALWHESTVAQELRNLRI